MSQAAPAQAVPPRSARFGPFELNLETGELRKHGVRVRLQHRPFQILAALIESPGRLVTREELRARLWPSDVFVDFESGLNTAVNRLRLSLGDSAENSAYIETLSRLGYRFLAPVEISSVPPDAVPAKPADAAPPAVAAPVLSIPPPPPSPAARPLRLWLSIAAMALLLAAITAAIALRFNRHEPTFDRLTFRKGFVSEARFFPGADRILYSAEWNGAPGRLFSVPGGRRESQDLSLSDAWLAGIVSRTEFGFFHRPGNGDPPQLAVASLAGGGPREIPGHFENADWGPDGSLCLLSAVGSTYTIQYPRGHILYRSSQWISNLRVSPNGAYVAITEHPIALDDAGHITIVDSATGQSRVLTQNWGSLAGLAWNPSASEVWFTAARSGVEKSLWAVTLDGHTRLVSQNPGGLELHDISRSGKVLVTRSNAHLAMLLGDFAHASEQDISWLDWSRAVALSADGRTVLFDETGSGGGAAYSVFLYRGSSSSPERIGSGRAMDLSSDGRFALTQDAVDASKLSVIEAHTHSAQLLPSHGFNYRWSKFFPDARQILVYGHYPGQPDGIYRQSVSAAPAPVNPRLALDDAVIDSTGQFASGVSDRCEITILNLKDGSTRVIKTGRMAYPLLFLDAGRILTRATSNKVITLESLDTVTGQSTPFGRIQPGDPTGLEESTPLRIARNLQTYVYSRFYSYSDLFLVTGLR